MWFRGLLGAGLAMIVALLVAPSIAGWFGGELPQSLFPLLPWAGSAQSSDRPGPGTAATPVAAEPRGGTSAESWAASSAPAPAARPAPGAEPGAPVSATRPEGERAGRERAGTGASTPASGGGSRSGATARAAESPSDATAPPAPPRGERLTVPPAVYWVQVGAFLDHANADRLAERLRSEGLPVGTTTFEQSRVVYRVLLTDPDGASASDELVERARRTGLTIEATSDGPAVSGLVPLRRAVEMSHTLRQQGVPVRLKQNASSATYRVVRVGSFRTSSEAEAALAALTGRGVEGVVVRER